MAGPNNALGGWPMVQQTWDQNKFSVMKAAGAARRYLNEAFLLSSFVYLDDYDVSKNVIYVIFYFSTFLGSGKIQFSRWINQIWLCQEICTWSRMILLNTSLHTRLLCWIQPKSWQGKCSAKNCIFQFGTVHRILQFDLWPGNVPDTISFIGNWEKMYRLIF